MNIKKFRKNLHKINALIGAEDVALNPIERDLVKSYLLNMYENLVQLDQPKAKHKTKETETINETLYVDPTPVILEELVEEKEFSPKNELFIEAKTESKPKEKIESPNTEKVEETIIERKPSPEPEPIAQSVPDASNNRHTRTIDSTLFDFKDGNELSDKLSNLPIADLTRCMGINEYIFTKDELFGGDQNRMVDSLEAMNKLANFSLAKIELEKLALEYDWDSPNKIKKAKNFIQLVRRRYN